MPQKKYGFPSDLKYMFSGIPRSILNRLENDEMYNYCMTYQHTVTIYVVLTIVLSVVLSMVIIFTYPLKMVCNQMFDVLNIGNSLDTNINLAISD